MAMRRCPTLAGVTARVGALLWIGSAVCYFVAEAVAAAVLHTYGYATDYVSTLGDPEHSPYAALMNAAFVVQALAFPIGGWLVCRAAQARRVLPFISLAVCNGVGNLLVAAVHSGSGSAWHGIGAAMALIGGNAAVLAGSSVLRSRLAAPAYRPVSIALGVFGLLCLFAVAFKLAPVGGWERGSVYTIYAWQVITAVMLIARGPGGTPR
jgi:hypothetical protein